MIIWTPYNPNHNLDFNYLDPNTLILIILFNLNFHLYVIHLKQPKYYFIQNLDKFKVIDKFEEIHMDIICVY